MLALLKFYAIVNLLLHIFTMKKDIKNYTIVWKVKVKYQVNIKKNTLNEKNHSHFTCL